MKIPIKLEKKSIENAIKTIEKVKNQLKTDVINDFLLESCKWVKIKANEYLETSGVGAKVIREIQLGWNISIEDNVAKLINISDKSVYVEFGVGIIGRENSHPLSEKSHYQYDIDTIYKNKNTRSWTFGETGGEEYVDLNKNYYEAYDFGDGVLTIVTRGQPATMYAYNALIDFKMYGAKNVWKNIKAKYWG